MLFHRASRDSTKNVNMFHILPFLFVSLLVGYAKSADDCDSPTAMSPFDFETIIDDWHIIAFAGEEAEKAYPQKIQSFDCPTATFGRNSMSKIQYRMEWVPGADQMQWTGPTGSPNPIDLTTNYGDSYIRKGVYTVMESNTDYIFAYFCTYWPPVYNEYDYAFGYYMILTKNIPSDTDRAALIANFETYFTGLKILNCCE